MLLENGGKDALIVDADVDAEWAAEQAALGAFANAGQICTSVEAIYVVADIAPAFPPALVRRAKALRTGPGTDPATQLGPLVDRRHRDAVHAHVASAVAAGAAVLAGGTVPDGEGSFYPATVLSYCTDDMDVMREEWRALPVGTVKINAVFGGAPGGAAQPRGRSGIGFGYGPELLDGMTATKVVHLGLPGGVSAVHGTREFARAVVTGGAGFLGSHLCEHLLERGIDVVCLDNFLTGTPQNVAHLMEHRGFRLVRCDVTDFVHVPGPVDLVMHFASPASPADYLRMPVETLKVGSLGTLHALGLAREKGARFVLASTSEVYGDPLQHPQREDYWGNVNPVGPRGVYDEAKRFSEALTTAYRLSRATDTAIGRIFNTFGPRMRPDDGRAIPTFMAQALAGEPLTVAGDGRQTRSICYVDDLVRGVADLAFSPHPGPVNIGNPFEVSMLDLAGQVIELTGSTSSVRFVDLPVDEPKVRRRDTGLAERLLGWCPRVPVEEGLRRTADWFSAQRISRAG